MKIGGNEIKVGNILEINNKLWKVLKHNIPNQVKAALLFRLELKDIKRRYKNE